MPKKHFLSQRQLESLTSPTRLAIVQRLEIDREATARELAQRMGRPVTALYHHLKQLEDAGVLRVVAERRGSRRPEAVYAMVGDYLSTAKAVKTAQGRRTYGRAAARVADAGVRAFSAAVARGAPRFDGEHRNAMVKYYLLRADGRKLARLNRLLDELDALAVQSSADGEEIHLTVLLAPLAPKGRRT
jgi:DNA-binding transcriptional ArsR family regulator